MIALLNHPENASSQCSSKSLTSHHDAVTFASRLKAEGHPPVRRWRHLLVGARNQDEAQALAAAIQAQAPPLAVVSVLRPYTAADVVRATRQQSIAQRPLL